MKDQVFNEPIATGWLRTELRGDTDLAKGYVMDARKLLGGMRIAFGVNQRIADGEPGGFYSLVRQLPDGSVMQAITNNGQDTIRITTRSAQQQSSADAPLTGTASKSTVQGESHSFVATHEDGPIPVPVLTRKTEEGDEKREEEDPQPYMWIGARVMVEKLAYSQNDSNGTWWDNLIIFVAEPPEVLTDGTIKENGVIANDTAAWSTFNVGVAPLDIPAQESAWALSYPWVGADRHQYSSGIVNFTKHLLRQYGAENSENRDDALTFGPFDPLEEPGDYEKRVVQVDANGNKLQYSLWDQVVVLDPYEGEAEPTSHRKVDADDLKSMQDALTAINEPMYGEEMIIPGGYQIFIGARGQDCTSSVASYPYNYGWNDELSRYPEALPVEIEVRVGKSPDTVTQNFQVVVPRYSEVRANYWPFGDGATYLACSLAGQNSHGANWWPGVITADPSALSITSAEEYVPSDLFGRNGVGTSCARAQWDIYVQIFQPYSEYASGNYPTEVSSQVWTLLTNARMGMYGEVSIPRRTQADVQTAAEAAIAATGSEGLYRYDVEENFFVAVSTPAEDPALTYDTMSFHTWEYVYRWQSILACRGFAKVRLGQGDPVFWGYTFGGDPDDVRNKMCC